MKSVPSGFGDAGDTSDVGDVGDTGSGRAAPVRAGRPRFITGDTTSSTWQLVHVRPRTWPPRAGDRSRARKVLVFICRSNERKIDIANVNCAHEVRTVTSRVVGL